MPGRRKLSEENLMAIPFFKMQGLGNDYIYIVADACPATPASMIRRMSDRHFGIGSDGVVFVLPAGGKTADVRMRMFNSDGTEAEMCGNAVRCVGKLAYEQGLARVNPLRVETAAGIKVLDLRIRDGVVSGARVDMGKPELRPSRVPVALEGDAKHCIGHRLDAGNGVRVEVSAVSMGNPHAVLFVDDVGEADVHGLGTRLERHPFFPRHTNVEFAQIIDRNTVRLRVWERGAGETLACGTGACATAVACVLNGFTDRKVDVRLPGGSLYIEWDEDTGHVFMTGPAETVFTGSWPENLCQEQENK